jgi:hypothetical protein
MPIHDVGYRGWPWKRSSAYMRWLSIAEYGFQIAIKSTWVKRLMLFAWLPILYWGVGIYIYESFVETSPTQSIGNDRDEKSSNNGDRTVQQELENIQSGAKKESSGDLASQALALTVKNQFFWLPMVDKLAERIAASDRSQWRRSFWNWLLMTYFRYPQSTTVVFILGFIAPSLIARDVRSRAFLLYFSRPIGRLDYMFGKLMIPAIFLVLVTTAPSLVLYLIGVLFSPDFSVIWNTWDVPIRILLASISLILPTASLALMLSSLSQESRFAAFAWFAVWALGYGAYLAVMIAHTSISKLYFTEVLQSPTAVTWAPISLYNCLGQVQTWIFGFDTLYNTWPSLLTLLAITFFSLLLFYRNISKSVHS